MADAIQGFSRGMRLLPRARTTNAGMRVRASAPTSAEVSRELDAGNRLMRRIRSYAPPLTQQDEAWLNKHVIGLGKDLLGAEIDPKYGLFPSLALAFQMKTLRTLENADRVPVSRPVFVAISHTITVLGNAFDALCSYADFRSFRNSLDHEIYRAKVDKDQDSKAPRKVQDEREAIISEYTPILKKLDPKWTIAEVSTPEVRQAIEAARKAYASASASISRRYS